MLEIIPLFLLLPRRINFKQMGLFGNFNEETYHNWFKLDLDLVNFNRKLIDAHGSGSYCVLFDPSYLPKSGQKTPQKGYFWSGAAQACKPGLEIGCFAVGDMQHQTAYHLNGTLTPNPKTLKAEGKTLLSHYVEEVKQHLSSIQHFGNLLVVDTYFGVESFITPVLAMNIRVISCLKSNACLYYAPPPVELVNGKKPVGRPREKGDKVDWTNPQNDKLPIVPQDDPDCIVRAGIVYVKALHRKVRIVAVEYRKADGTLQKRKLYFSTDLDMHPLDVLAHYQLRFHIEFNFRDGKQFVGLTNCQSTQLTKLENHLNIALTAVSVAKVTHGTHHEKNDTDKQPFSMLDIKQYYHNTYIVELISNALNIDLHTIKNNKTIKNALFPNDFDLNAA